MCWGEVQIRIMFKVQKILPTVNIVSILAKRCTEQSFIINNKEWSIAEILRVKVTWHFFMFCHMAQYFILVLDRWTIDNVRLLKYYHCSYFNCMMKMTCEAVNLHLFRGKACRKENHQFFSFSLYHEPYCTMYYIPKL